MHFSFTALLTAELVCSSLQSCFVVVFLRHICTGVMIMVVAGSRGVAEVVVRPQEVGQVATGASSRGRPGTAVLVMRKRDKSQTGTAHILCILLSKTSFTVFVDHVCVTYFHVYVECNHGALYVSYSWQHHNVKLQYMGTRQPLACDL